ncbi:hypothetical protein [Gordonibacter sp.]|uniref:hypothetical protein n=1 Tax=Gordonibacter sp. TaxID=1968902 RepID=UPI002FC61511
MKITATEIVRLLRSRYEDGRQFATATEVSDTTGSGTRRLDFVAVNCYASKGFAIEGIEVKVSKADLRRELQDASKHNIFFDFLDYYSLACPADILDMSLIPPKWGVYVVKEDGRLHTKRLPLALHDELRADIDKAFAVCLMRRIAYGSPAEKEKRRIQSESYAKGKRDAEESMGYRFKRLESTEGELLAYKSLFKELTLFGADDIERGIKGFKAFQELDRKSLRGSLERLVEKIGDVVSVLPEDVG